MVSGDETVIFASNPKEALTKEKLFRFTHTANPDSSKYWNSMQFLSSAEVGK